MHHPMHKEPSFLDKALSTAQTGVHIYGTGKALFEMGKGLYTMARVAGPLLALA